jgi:hypothetical protein
MKAPYFPFALVGLELIQGGPIAALRAFTGLACAHLYYFLTTVRYFLFHHLPRRPSAEADTC